MKKFLLVLGMAACLLGVTSFNQITAYAATETITEAEAMDNAVGFAEQMNEIVTSGMKEQYVGYDALYNALVSWENALEGMGGYQGIISAEGIVDGDNLTITAVVDGITADADMTIVVNHVEGAIISIQTEVQKTFGELMTNAALNTLLGMGTVFVVLILIAWLISMFKYIGVFQDKMAGKKTEKPATAPAPAPVAAAPVVEVAEEDDLELIAVIAAAIAASEGAASADGFVVRSIKRRGSKWQKA